MRILLTGASGYIGLHVLRELVQDGHQVTAVVRSAASMGRLTLEASHVAEIDLMEDPRLSSVMMGHDVCVHTAFIWGNLEAELAARDVGVASTLFDAAGQAGIDRIILLSSTAVHRPFSGEMDEGSVLVTADLYGATKAAGELFLRSACTRHGMTGIVLRPGPVVGPSALPTGFPRTPRRLAELVQAALEGRGLEVCGGEGRQFVSVTDLVKAVRLLVGAVLPLPTYICADRHAIAWSRVAEMVVAATGSNSRVHVLPGSEDVASSVRFQTDRFEDLLGTQTDATHAMENHIRLLADSGSATGC